MRWDERRKGEGGDGVSNNTANMGELVEGKVLCDDNKAFILNAHACEHILHIITFGNMSRTHLNEREKIRSCFSISSFDKREWRKCFYDKFSFILKGRLSKALGEEASMWKFLLLLLLCGEFFHSFYSSELSRDIESEHLLEITRHE